MDRPPLRLHADIPAPNRASDLAAPDVAGPDFPTGSHRAESVGPKLSETVGGDDGQHRGTQARERDLDRIAGTGGSRSFAVALGSIIPLLMEAVENDRAWLKDFADETVRIDADLYDVLLAYQQLRRPAAA